MNRRKYWMEKNGWLIAIDLLGCSFGLEKNGMCDYLLCKYRSSKSDEQKYPTKLGELMCPRNIERALENQLHARDAVSSTSFEGRSTNLGK